MKTCGNVITIAHFKNGKSQVMGSADIVKNTLSPSINGHYSTEPCRGILRLELSTATGSWGGIGDGEIEFEFRCDFCGISHGNMGKSIEDIKKIVESHI